MISGRKHASQIQTLHCFMASLLGVSGMFSALVSALLRGGVLFGLIEPVDTVPGLGSGSDVLSVCC